MRRFARRFSRVGLLLSITAVSSASYAGNAFVSNYKTPPPMERNASTHALAPASNATQTGWVRFYFDEPDTGVGDASVNPFGGDVEFKLNAVNYNLYLGDANKIPFQLYFGDFASEKSQGDSNNAKLLDPTQGAAIMFPVSYRYLGDGKGGFCQFPSGRIPGFCALGGDITLRGVKLAEKTTDGTGGTKQSYVFGGSASLAASLQFPIFQNRTDSAAPPDGKLGISVGVRYYYHNTDQQKLLFGTLQDPNGTPVDARKGFAGINALSEFDIFKYFKIRLEYFSPLNNRGALDDVFKASIVMAPK